MSDLSMVLKNRNRLKAAAKALTYDELQKLKSDVEALIQERQEKQNKIEALKAMMKEQGLSANDLVEAGIVASSEGSELQTTMKTRKPVEPKYKITDANGETHFWSGRGRTPKAFQEYFDLGHSKDSCAI